jgi:hypothetical protein
MGEIDPELRVLKARYDHSSGITLFRITVKDGAMPSRDLWLTPKQAMEVARIAVLLAPAPEEIKKAP